jgi:hypothetical protein
VIIVRRCLVELGGLIAVLAVTVVAFPLVLGRRPPVAAAPVVRAGSARVYGFIAVMVAAASLVRSWRRRRSVPRVDQLE